MSGPNEISCSAVSRLIGLPDAPVLLDARTDEDRALDPSRLPAARLIDPFDLSPEVPKGARVVVYCQKGGKISQAIASALQARGVDAQYLEGGHLAWIGAGRAAVPLDLPPVGLWVTRQRPKIDRIACPWLIRRFVAPEARFLFVAAAQVADTARIFGAQAFDVEGAEWSHEGALCTFDTMLARFGLMGDGALMRVAQVVRAADTNRHDLAPEAAGLLALSVGLSRMYRSDQAQLEAGMALYDALYRWARDGQGEGHDWPGPGAAA